jgi:hypothetical protein
VDSRCRDGGWEQGEGTEQGELIRMWGEIGSGLTLSCNQQRIETESRREDESNGIGGEKKGNGRERTYL